MFGDTGEEEDRAVDVEGDTVGMGGMGEDVEVIDIIAELIPRD